MTPTQLAGDAILVSAALTIVALVRRSRRRARKRPAVRDRGQAIVEMALVTAVFLPLALTASQVALLLSYRLAQQQATGTLAAVAAYNGPGPSFDAAVASESTRIDCESPEAVLSAPVAGVIVVDLRCTWRAPAYHAAAWPVSTSASAAATPSPAPSPSPSPAP